MWKRVLPLFLAAALMLGMAPAMAAGNITLAEQYTFAGAVTGWFAEESYYAAPCITDLDGDGKLEVLLAAHSLAVLDAATGVVKWRINSGKDRSTPFDTWGNGARQVFCDVAVMDVNGDGAKEIAVGYANGTVSLLNKDGYFMPGWPKIPSYENAIRCVRLADLDLDGRGEVIVGVGVADDTSVWVYNLDGTVKSGWPQLSRSQNGNYNTSTSGSAYAYGVFADSIAVGDLDGRPGLEMVIPTDMAFISAYHADGSLVTAHPQYGGRAWGKVALWEDYGVEIACENEGWGWSDAQQSLSTLSRKDLYRTELGHSAARFSDVDGDGTEEIVVTALMTDRTTHTRTNRFTTADTRYMTVYILNKDRSRYQNAALGYDWSEAPKDLGGPLKAMDTNSVTTGVLSEPVCADLDGDGKQEILFNSYNGKLHCFSLDKQEHGSWPFVMPQTGGGRYEYATAPVCKDLDGDGKLEVIFASWLANDQGANTGVNGALYVVDYQGKLLAKQPLHDGYCTYEGVVYNSNNVFATPEVADIDGDGRYEILLNTSYYGLCCYEVRTGAVPASQPVGTAYASTQSVLVDGKPAEFAMYALKDPVTGYMTNYVKVRDVAYIVRKCDAHFDVRWDGVVNLMPDAAYTPNGTEMSTPFSGDWLYSLPTTPTKVCNVPTALEAIVLTDNAGGGYTYYKLRDLGDALNFDVEWDGERHIICIDTHTPYPYSW